MYVLNGPGYIGLNGLLSRCDGLLWRLYAVTEFANAMFALLTHECFCRDEVALLRSDCSIL